MHGQNIGDNQPIVVPTNQWSDQGYWSQHGNYHQMNSSAYQTAAASIPPMSNNPTTTTTASFSPYYPYNHNKIHSGGSLYPTTTSEAASFYTQPNPPIPRSSSSYQPRNHRLDDSDSPDDTSSSNKENEGQVITIKGSFPPFIPAQKAQNNTAVKLCYKMDQLELLNAIYSEMKYPNSVQKTMIANIIGISREQTKIWFQNRRRKDTLMAQGKIVAMPGVAKQKRKSDDDSEDSINNDPTPSPDSPSMAAAKPVVDQSIVDKVLLSLRQHQNAPDRLSSKRVKRPKPDSNDEREEETNTKLEPSPVQQQSVKKLVLEEPSVVVCTATTSSSSEEESGVNLVGTKQTPKFYQMQQPLPINDYMTQSYSAYPKYPKQYNATTLANQEGYPSQTYASCYTAKYGEPQNWSSSQTYNYNQVNSYLAADHSSAYYPPPASYTSPPPTNVVAPTYPNTTYQFQQQPNASSHAFQQYNSSTSSSFNYSN